MKIFQILFAILLCLDYQGVSATSTYQKNDMLYVWATSGLNMREGPGTDFPKMKKLEYGDKVEVIDNYLRSTSLSLTVVKKSKKSDAFIMNGHWVRVKIGTREGYVFDGYLSKFPVLKIKKVKEFDVDTWRSEGLHEYLKREIGVLENKSDTVYNQHDSTYWEFTKKTIKAKNYISSWERLGKCYDGEIIFEEMTFQEVYLFINILHRFEEVRKLQKKYQEKFDWQIRTVKMKKGKPIFNFGEELWEGSLIEKDGKFIFQDFACC